MASLSLSLSLFLLRAIFDILPVHDTLSACTLWASPRVKAARLPILAGLLRLPYVYRARKDEDAAVYRVCRANPYFPLYWNCKWALGLQRGLLEGESRCTSGWRNENVKFFTAGSSSFHGAAVEWILIQVYYILSIVVVIRYIRANSDSSNYRHLYLATPFYPLNNFTFISNRSLLTIFWVFKKFTSFAATWDT